MLEQWNAGILGFEEMDQWFVLYLKPLFHYSIIPFS
jgi:hypothetical protein